MFNIGGVLSMTLLLASTTLLAGACLKSETNQAALERARAEPGQAASLAQADTMHRAGARAQSNFIGGKVAVFSWDGGGG